MDLQIRQADLTNPSELDALIELTRAYAKDEQGLGCDLDPGVVDALPNALASHPAILAFIAWADGRPVGQATCLLSFSTFAAKPIINIHDLNVIPAFRGKGIAKELLEAVADHAKATGCCRVTLEVSATNSRARHIYAEAGYRGALEHDDARITYFCGKSLD